MPFWAIRLSACFRPRAHRVDVQNYIDNTGVQVADVVVGFLYLEKKGKSEIEKMIAAAGPPPHSFDYYCWDLYARFRNGMKRTKNAPEASAANPA